MKKLKTFIISIVVLIIATPAILYLNNQADVKHCFPGYKAGLSWTGGTFVHMPCVKKAPDTDKACKVDSECSLNVCIPFDAYRAYCDLNGPCVDVKGKCAAVEGDQNAYTIPSENVIRTILLK